MALYSRILEYIRYTVSVGFYFAKKTRKNEFSEFSEKKTNENKTEKSIVETWEVILKTNFLKYITKQENQIGSCKSEKLTEYSQETTKKSD